MLDHKSVIGAKSRTFSLLVAAGLSATMLASCGQQTQQTSSEAQNEDDQPETVIVYRDSTEQQDDSGNSGSSTSSTSSDSSTELPEGYPVPLADDHEVQDVRVGGDDPDDEGDVDVDILVPDGQAAYDYYTQTLESEGFTIEETDVDNDSSEFDADIDFRNDQYEGGMDFSGTNLEIDLDQQNTTANSSGNASGSSTSDDTSDDESSGDSTSDGDIPSDFPLPGEYEIQNVRVGGDDGDDRGDVSIILNVADGRAAYDYYVQNLESEGFRVEETEVESDSGQFEGDIDFDGDSYDGSVDVRGNTVDIDIDRTDN